jgi:beta-1,4-mannooligosaccharide/beta-1,4-mannosyl-N-acetylglucosamine phosphorylase
MKTIFETVLHSRQGMGDVQTAVDPFTGRTTTVVPVVVRHPENPVASRAAFFESAQEWILSGAMSGERISPRLHQLEDTFNCGIAHHDGRYVMLVRYQSASRYNHIYLATSDDGVRWDHIPELLDLPGLPAAPDAQGIAKSGWQVGPDTKWHPGLFYDPRVTQLEDGSYLVALAVDYDSVEPPGQPYAYICDNVLYRTQDFKKFEFLCTLQGHTRNCVIFPRQIDGWYYAAGRPNASKRVNTVLFRSKDLRSWEQTDELFTGGHAWMIYAGPGFPPFETEDYWVMGVHAVETHGTFQVVYRAGVCLLDKKTLKVVAGPVPILHPDQPYETDGTIGAAVIFPTGCLFSDGKHSGIKSRDTKVAIYYGAADSFVGVGMTTVGRLIDAALGTYNPFQLTWNTAGL